MKKLYQIKSQQILFLKFLVKNYFSFTLFMYYIIGLAEYIDGDYEITSFDYIRNCLTKRKEPHLTLVENQMEDNELAIEDFPDEKVNFNNNLNKFFFSFYLILYINMIMRNLNRVFNKN